MATTELDKETYRGIIETYFNVQKDLMPALRSWSRMGFLFDLAEDVNNNTVVQVLLSEFHIRCTDSRFQPCLVERE